MRIGVDVRFISHGLVGGLRTYVLNLARELPRVSPRDEFVFYADAKAPLELERVPDNVTVRVLPWSSGLSTIVNDRRLSSVMARDHVEVAHFPGNYGSFGTIPTVVTLHDAITLFPLRYQWRGLSRRPRLLAMTTYTALNARYSAPRAARLIAPSEHARRDIAARSAVPLDRIDVIHEAAGSEFRRLDRDAVEAYRRRLNLPARVVVADAIKNAPAVIHAYRALPEALRHSSAIALFSREDTPRPAVAREIDDHVRFINRPTTDELALLFNLADLFVFPSWFEGFGLPLVEAMQCGAAVAGATRGSIPEIVGDAGLLFDLEDTAALTTHLAAVLGSNEQRERLSRQSLARADSFSWSRAAELTMDTYRRAVATAQ